MLSVFTYAKPSISLKILEKAASEEKCDFLFRLIIKTYPLEDLKSQRIEYQLNLKVLMNNGEQAGFTVAAELSRATFAANQFFYHLSLEFNTETSLISYGMVSSLLIIGSLTQPNLPNLLYLVSGFHSTSNGFF